MPNQTNDLLNSNEVKNFISKHIRSITHLKVLLLLYQNQRQEFSIKMFEEALNSSSELLVKVSNELLANKLIGTRMNGKLNCYWYLTNEERNPVLALINKAYSKNSSEVIDLILKK